MKVPFPSVSSDLAVSAHMYICVYVNNFHYEFVKCQTLKPYMLINDVIKHYCDEASDINRNPFKHATRIDCDKVFISEEVSYDEKLLTTSRLDICEELFLSIKKELEADGFVSIAIDEINLVALNNLITFIINKIDK